MNNQLAPSPEPHNAAAPAPQEIAELDRRLGLDIPHRDDVKHSGEGVASIIRRLICG
jgi:hypothetical protein